jgi:hypothetical protein
MLRSTSQRARHYLSVETVCGTPGMLEAHVPARRFRPQLFQPRSLPGRSCRGLTPSSSTGAARAVPSPDLYTTSDDVNERVSAVPLAQSALHLARQDGQRNVSVSLCVDEGFTESQERSGTSLG